MRFKQTGFGKYDHITLVAFTLLFFSGVMWATETRLPSVLGTGRVELGAGITINGRAYPYTFLDGMFLPDGILSVKIGNVQSKVTVNTVPQKERILGTVEGFTYATNVPVLFLDPRRRSLEPVGRGTEVRIDEIPKILLNRDMAGNVGDATCSPPLLEKLDILDSQSPITNVAGKKFLLTSRSPYRLVGRVILTENSALILEDGVSLSMALSTLTVKGLFFSLGRAELFGNGTIFLTEGGLMSLMGVARGINVRGDGGALLQLDVAAVASVELDYTNFVIIRNSSVGSVRINGAYALFIVDSSIDRLEVQNCRYVVINNSELNAAKFEAMSDVTVYSSKFSRMVTSDLTNVKVIGSLIGQLDNARGGVLKLKKSDVQLLRNTDFGVAYLFETNVRKLENNSAKVERIRFP